LLGRRAEKKKGETDMKASGCNGKSIIFLGAVFCLLPILFSAASALEYPTKPITVIVSASAGGPLDVHARILAEVASKELGAPIVIINKAGPGGALAASFVAHEKPDGYTFLVTFSAAMTSNFALFPNLTYKRSDFIPLFMTNITPINIAVKADSPYKGLKDLLDAAAKNPGKVRSASSSPNLGLVWEGLLKHEGIQIKHMLHKGAADCFLALMGGHTDCYIDALTPILPHVEAGKVRLLASISSKRNKKFPEVLTLKELGHSNFSRDFWGAFFAPAGLPEPIMSKFVKVFEKTLSLPNVQSRLENAGVIPNFMGPREFAEFMDQEFAFYMDLAKQQKQ
jgi:tripartite-type tricarboxylate transporter receptor subunit TctC